MNVARWLFLLPATLLPASFVGLALYYLVTVPTKDDFFVGPAGALTGTVLLFDAVLGALAFAGFLYSLWIAPAERRELCIMATLSVLASAAAYGLAMQVLRYGYRLPA
ncbi:hypothetical protein [Cupriavidus sp. BIS7]|uniref:hypothetical protein n=1 Tax=Cupriavidus sp. BIS7 TaxID=1217718 RepID=UPI0003705485|nr:hypothetical protein [Cupriavidus sp. BIS7]